MAGRPIKEAHQDPRSFLQPSLRRNLFANERVLRLRRTFNGPEPAALQSNRECPSQKINKLCGARGFGQAKPQMHGFFEVTAQTGRQIFEPGGKHLRNNGGRGRSLSILFWYLEISTGT